MNVLLFALFIFLMAFSGARPNGAWLLAGLVAVVLLYRLGVFRAGTWIGRDAHTSLDIRDGVGTHVVGRHAED